MPVTAFAMISRPTMHNYNGHVHVQCTQPSVCEDHADRHANGCGMSMGNADSPPKKHWAEINLPLSKCQPGNHFCTTKLKLCLPLFDKKHSFIT